MSVRAPRLQARDEVVGDRPVDDHARARRAALAGRPERGPQDPVGREVEVRVLEHHDGVLAAELEAEPLELAAGPLGDRPARLRAAGERDDADVRVVDDRVADVAAGAGDEVDDAGRKARLVHELDEERRAQRRVASWA